MIIYGVECNLCGVQYTGKTVQQLRSRISGHRAWMKKTKDKEKDQEDGKWENEDEATLAEHLKAEHELENAEDFNNAYKFTVLQFCAPSTIDKLEQIWISRLKTMTPYGLNISKPLGICDSILEAGNSQRQQ